MKTKKGTFFIRLSLFYAKISAVLIILNSADARVFSQPKNPTEIVTISVSEKFSTLDTLTATASDAAAERIRDLIFNSLVKKDEKFDYTGDLAREIKTSEDGKTITFILRDNVKFHNGKILTTADVKYTFDELFKSSGYKSSAFFKTVAGNRVPYVTSITIPTSNTVKFVLSRASLKNHFLSNLAAIPIIPEQSVAQQNTHPVGSGAFIFVNFNPELNILELRANPDYFDGAPTVQNVRVKTVTDAAALQTALESGAVDIAPLPDRLPPDILKSFEQNPKLKVEQFGGANIDYLGFNTKSAVLKKVKIRQAIAYGIDRQKIIDEVLHGQAKIAYSVLPAESWAYFEAAKYGYNPARARQLIRESGYKNERILFNISVGNRAVIQYAQVIQDSLRAVGLNVEIEALEPNTLRQKLAFGEFQMNTGRWIGGNQDPIFLEDLFSTGAIPGGRISCCNRSRYSNARFDKIIEEASGTADREKAKILYAEVQKIVGDDLPLLPLWYPANLVIANKRIANIKINPNGDWSFVKNLRINN